VAVGVAVVAIEEVAAGVTVVAIEEVAVGVAVVAIEEVAAGVGVGVEAGVEVGVEAGVEAGVVREELGKKVNEGSTVASDPKDPSGQLGVIPAQEADTPSTEEESYVVGFNTSNDSLL